MKVKRLVLKNFRNYSDLSWQPDSFINIISGNNAQGKTNILEALFFCANGRSFKTAKDKDIIGLGGDESYASTKMEKNNSCFEISVCISNQLNSVFCLNGKRTSKNNLYRPGYAVAFTPSDLDLIVGAPSGRRKWLDLELGIFNLHYNYILTKYEKVVTQRNNLLKISGRQSNIKKLIEPWNEQLFNYGSNLIKIRMDLLKQIFPYLREIVYVLTDGKEELTFNYVSSLPLEKGIDEKGIQKVYREMVVNCFQQEINRKQTLFGPHRDDLLFFLNGINVKNFGSRGQQRSVVLALKIALLKMFNNDFFEYPILLLDDVFLELDIHRQKGLVNLLSNDIQVFITSDRRLDGYFDGKESKFFVSEGKIIKGDC